MASSFDNAAMAYDATFTNSSIGKLQRRQVYAHLLEVLKRNDDITSVLEINCGTGEDALWLAGQGLKVTATDISEKMIAVAKSKASAGNLVFEQADINRLRKHFPTQKFDMIFSNFGGLNCLTKRELETFFKNAGCLLSEKGLLALVIMPEDTLWEQFYFLAKADFKNIFRRKKEMVLADVDGEKVPTYYYNPQETVTLASGFFNFKNLWPIGFFVPPSYLETFFKNKTKALTFLGKLENAVKNRQFLAKNADHYFIIFEKK